MAEEVGFNGARLGRLWAGVTPTKPGVADPTYFKRLDRVTKLFTDESDLSTVKMDKLRRLVRTCPQATAGIPTRISYDPATGDFSMTYRPTPGISSPTQIFVSPLTSPHGYDVHVTGGRAQKAGSLVQVRATSLSQVKVTVPPRG
ncbi:MAG: hypothetical protein ABIR34_00090 [Marmoricola sp.]